MKQLIIYCFVALCAAGSISAAGALAADEVEQLKVENALLRAEYEFARKGQIYLLLNFEKKQFEVRASGVSVVTIPFQEVRAWGPYPEPGAHLVSDKDRVPPREKIKIPPPEGETAPPPAPAANPAAPPVVKKFELQATEVTDMPRNYSLWLEGGGLIAIKSFDQAEGKKSRLAGYFEKPWWKVSHALQSIKAQRQNRIYTELMLVMTPHDAQRLYWTLPLGTAILIPPSTP